MVSNVFPLCLLYALSSLAYGIDIIKLLNKHRTLTMYILCKAMYMIVEGISPLIIHSIFYSSGSVDGWSIPLDYTYVGIDSLWISWFLSVAGYFFISVGYRSRYRFVIGKLGEKRKTAIADNEYDAKLQITAFLTLVIGVISLMLWTRAYGGIFSFISNANAIRSGFTNVNNTLGFFKHFASCILIASYAYFVMLRYFEKNKHQNLILFCIALLFSTFYLLASDGRMGAGFYLITLVFIFIQKKVIKDGKTIGIRRIVLICVAGLAVISLMMKMDDFTYFLRNGVWQVKSKEHSTIAAFVYELSFVLRSEQLAIQGIGEVGCQLMNDIFYGFTAWLPSSIFPSSFLRLWTVNTMLAGASVGELPCGIVAQGYYDLYFIGVFVLTYLYGRIIKKTDCMSIETPFGMTLYASFLFSMLRIVAYGMIYDFMQGIFKIVVFIVIYKSISLLYRCISEQNQ